MWCDLDLLLTDTIKPSSRIGAEAREHPLVRMSHLCTGLYAFATLITVYRWVTLSVGVTCLVLCGILMMRVHLEVIGVSVCRGRGARGLVSELLLLLLTLSCVDVITLIQLI